MKSDELRAAQAPLKKRYRESPEAALVIHRAEGSLGERITCRIESAGETIVAGLHPAAGGDGSHICSGDMLLDALVACAGVTMNAVATALGIPLRRAHLRAEGELDFRGTLGVSREVPVGFLSITLRAELDTDASEEQIAALLRSTEKYCVVAQSLANLPRFEAVRIPARADDDPGVTSS